MSYSVISIAVYNKYKHTYFDSVKPFVFFCSRRELFGVVVTVSIRNVAHVDVDIVECSTNDV